MLRFKNTTLFKITVEGSLNTAAPENGLYIVFGRLFWLLLNAVEVISAEK